MFSVTSSSIKELSTWLLMKTAHSVFRNCIDHEDPSLYNYKLLLEWAIALTFKAALLQIHLFPQSLNYLDYNGRTEILYWCTTCQSHQVVNSLNYSKNTKNSSCISWTFGRVLCRYPLVIVYMSGLMTPNGRSSGIQTRYVSLSPSPKP